MTVTVNSVSSVSSLLTERFNMCLLWKMLCKVEGQDSLCHLCIQVSMASSHNYLGTCCTPIFNLLDLGH